MAITTKPITSQITNTYRVTEQQLQSVLRCLDPETGAVSYEVQSQSEPETKYLVKWDHRFHMWRCTPLTGHVCPASAQGIVCWHLKAAAATEMMEQEALASEQTAAAIREAKAVKRDGDLAYSRKPFSLLKTA
jgi:hypothetical protein